MLRWYIDYFGLKLHKKQLVPKKKKTKQPTLTTLPPTLFSLKAGNKHQWEGALPMGGGGLPYHQREGIQGKKAV